MDLKTALLSLFVLGLIVQLATIVRV